jgi:RecA/RadA recombinase
MAMRTRMQSLKRILAVQKDLLRLAEWKLALLQRKESDLQKDQERIVAYLDENHSFTPAYAKMIASRLRTLAVQRQETATERQQQAERVLEQARRVGQAERMVDAAAETLRRVEERKELADTIEAAVNRKQASPR